MIDERYFYPLFSLKQPPFSVLYVGSFQEMKRPQLILNFARRFPNILFKLIGTGPLLDHCRQLATDKIPNVEFLGQLPQVTIGDEMRAADIFLFPSISEGHPQVIGQALACGLPVVCMSNYQPDFVIHHQTGFLANTDDELFVYFQKLIEDHELRKKFSENSITHAKKFNNQHIIAAWEQMIIHTLNRNE